MAIKALHKSIEIAAQAFSVVEETVQVNLDKKQRQPLEVLPYDRSPAFFVDGLSMPDNILFIDQKHFPTDPKPRIIGFRIGMAEEGTVSEMMIEKNGGYPCPNPPVADHG